MTFQDKVCVVTGASSGIGRRVALDLAADGARVCVAARREDRLRALVDEMEGANARHSYLVTDVSQRAHAKALAAHVAEHYGRCDLLVNNAGFPGKRGGFTDASSIDNVEAVMATNFLGAVYCTGELLGLLAASAPASVVNVASVAGRVALAGVSAYCASKFALAGWSEAIHFELKGKGIQVAVVEPGFVPTEGFPQTDLVSGTYTRRLLGTERQVSETIRRAALGSRPERVTPRWYYQAQVLRAVAPRLWWFVNERIAKSFNERRARQISSK